MDYLLKLQESIRDFYWHHAHQDALELPARESFLIAFKVARQMFRTLSEYIQVRVIIYPNKYIICVRHFYTMLYM